MSLLMLPTEALTRPDEHDVADVPGAGDRALTLGVLGVVIAAAMAAVFLR